MTAARYLIDGNHSQLHMDIDHLGGVSTLTLRWGGLGGTWTWERAAGHGRLALTVDATTLSSGLVKGDPIMTGDKVFDTARHATMELDIATVPTVQCPARVKARFTMLGIAREIEADVLTVRTGTNRRLNKEVVGLRLTAALNRSAWGMDMGVYPSLGDELRLRLNLEALAAD